MREPLFVKSRLSTQNPDSKAAMIRESDLTVRKAVLADRQNLANLIHFETHVHRHLDWRSPLDWLGYEPYVVAEYRGKIVAALACPPDPPHVAWIRLFAVAGATPLDLAWRVLFPLVEETILSTDPVAKVTGIPLQNWMADLLSENGFVHSHDVVMLNWGSGQLPPERHTPNGFIRPMTLDDLACVWEVDQAAFVPEWQNSLESLELAFRQAAVATVFEQDGALYGYQISTPTPVGGHLARLAVHPAMQRQGVGYSLVRDVLGQFNRRGARRVTVNTQHNNHTSLALYQQVGFRQTNERYPVYQYQS
ncbi:MAG TPA: GNAT family N-acetyltransferase [Anaerolineales bacterium]|nr:GNAT family N-acetyltransferase [Anaerolineales bacterium]